VSAEYKAVGWNAQKKTYDATIAAACVLYVAAFAGIGALVFRTSTAETLLIRAFGTLALLLLHVILVIGPLARLDRRVLPLLYNRRHLGVAMFLVALLHGAFSVVQFHALGDTNPLVSLLTSNTQFRSLANFPFELLGACALLIFFLMAATSHDFWLHNLTPAVWKRLHMCIYLAYALVVAHVCLGALQQDRNVVLASLLAVGLIAVSTLHLVAARGESRTDSAGCAAPDDSFVDVCAFEDIPEGRARVVTVNGERVAVFRHGGKVSSISNVCRHQNGPLGEGRIIDGCVTCPWHGYQYDPVTGAAPPPFEDKVPVFPVEIIGRRVRVGTCPKPMMIST